MTDQPRMGRPDSSGIPGQIRSGSPFAPGSDSATPPTSGSAALSAARQLSGPEAGELLGGGGARGDTSGDGSPGDDGGAAGVGIAPPVGPHRAVPRRGVSAATAAGALLASSLVSFFTATTTWLFPLGGCLVAPLGVFLALLGLRSGRPRIAGALAIFHAACFAASLVRL